MRKNSNSLPVVPPPPMDEVMSRSSVATRDMDILTRTEDPAGTIYVDPSNASFVSMPPAR